MFCTFFLLHTCTFVYLYLSSMLEIVDPIWLLKIFFRYSKHNYIYCLRIVALLLNITTPILFSFVLSSLSFARHKYWIVGSSYANALFSYQCGAKKNILHIKCSMWYRHPCLTLICILERSQFRFRLLKKNTLVNYNNYDWNIFGFLIC